ncbi:MAG: NAD(P)/FAD-dependent oxidoreductase [Acidobacteria bacterium]|nr:NAD(P)/FAD-dependent oxidoreductase [Acidobacteriota bacterium]
MASVEKDVVIIGGGPAGMAASIWCSDLGLSNIVLERGDSTGGQLKKIFQPVRNYPGIQEIDSRKLADEFAEQAKALGGDLRIDSSAASIDPKALRVELASGEWIKAKAVVLATGVRRRRLDLPGETELSGVLESGAKQAAETTNARVVVVGGGDAAFENALILAKFASEVTLVHHSSHFRARAEFLEPVRQNPKIKIIENAVVTDLFGSDGKLQAVGLKDPSGVQRIETDFLLVRTGVMPNSELVEGLVTWDARGYVIIDANCETSAPMIFAIGDVAAPSAPTIATAVGHAATAVKVIKARLERP